MVRRTKTSMFLDCKEGNLVIDVKKMIEGIIKRPPEDQRLFKDEQILDDNKTLGDCGFTNQTSKAQTPAILGLALRQDGETNQIHYRSNICCHIYIFNSMRVAVFRITGNTLIFKQKRKMQYVHLKSTVNFLFIPLSF